MNTLIKPAATVILMRDTDDGFEIFMVKRSPRGAFGSLHVFPGGTLDPEDSSPILLQHCEGLSDIEASKKLGLSSGGLAYWIATIRECFEEVGILLTHQNDPLLKDTSKLMEYRDQLNNKEITFQQICEAENLTLRANNIVPCALWITPVFEPKRFDTRFFLVKVDSLQAGSHDGFELTDSFWISPTDALDKMHQGEMNMILPTIHTLTMLAVFSNSQEAFDDFNSKKDADIPAILPKFVKKDDEWLTFLPGEDGYAEA